jgi:hypothetical protein
VKSFVNGGISINNVSSNSNVRIGDTTSVMITSKVNIYAGTNSYVPGERFGILVDVDSEIVLYI